MKAVNNTNDDKHIVTNGYVYKFPKGQVLEVNDLNVDIIEIILHIGISTAGALTPAQSLVAEKTPSHIQLDGAGTCAHTGLISL